MRPGTTPRWEDCDGDGESQTSPFEVSNILLRGLVEVVQQLGVSPQVLLGDAFEELYGDPAERMIPLDELQSALARAVRLTGDPALGLSWGMRAASYGVIGPLIAHAPTLRRAIALICQFQPLFGAWARIHVEERLGAAHLRCELARGVIDRSFVEMLQVGLVRLLRAYGCSRTDIRAVCFEYPKPSYRSVYAFAFSDAERFSQSFTGIEFSAATLDRPNVHHEPVLHGMMLGHAERKLAQRSRPLCCSDRVRSLLSSAPLTQLPDMQLLARKLGTSVRSLRRRLQEEGTSYRDLTQTLLHDAACSMLRNPELTLQSIGHALGFADSATFHRAFRRWANLTPADYRATLLTAH